MRPFAVIVRRRQEGWRLAVLSSAGTRRIWWASRDAMIARLREL